MMFHGVVWWLPIVLVTTVDGQNIQTLAQAFNPPTPKFQCCKAVRGHGPSGQNKSNPQDISTAVEPSYLNIKIWAAGLVVKGTSVQAMNILVHLQSGTGT